MASELPPLLVELRKDAALGLPPREFGLPASARRALELAAQLAVANRPSVDAAITSARRMAEVSNREMDATVSLARGRQYSVEPILPNGPITFRRARRNMEKSTLALVWLGATGIIVALLVGLPVAMPNIELFVKSMWR